jgi:hypothetical protein
MENPEQLSALQDKNNSLTIMMAMFWASSKEPESFLKSHLSLV